MCSAHLWVAKAFWQKYVYVTIAKLIQTFSYVALSGMFKLMDVKYSLNLD